MNKCLLLKIMSRQMTMPISLVYQILQWCLSMIILKVFCACVIPNATKDEICKKNAGSSFKHIPLMLLDL